MVTTQYGLNTQMLGDLLSQVSMHFLSSLHLCALYQYTNPVISPRIHWGGDEDKRPPSAENLAVLVNKDQHHRLGRAM